jgi:hypothetical protein
MPVIGKVCRGFFISFDSCGPVKIVYSICDTDSTHLFFPKIMKFSDREGPGGISCVTEQAMPEVIEQSLKAHGKEVSVIRPRLYLENGLTESAVIESFTVYGRRRQNNAG